MAARRPFVQVNGQQQELPAADTLNAYARDNIKIPLVGAPANGRGVMWYNPVERTVASVFDKVRGGTITYNIHWSADGEATGEVKLWNSDRAADTAGSTTVFSNAVIPAGRWVWMNIVSNTGTITSASINLLLN